MSAAARPDLSYIVGGCMDSCVHIWHFTGSPEAAAAAARTKAESSGKEGSTSEQQQQQPPGSEIIEYSCGGYSSKVTSTVFNGDHTMLASLGGTQCTVWDFTGPQGPAGSIPVVGLGHTKTVTCQVRSTPKTVHSRIVHNMRGFTRACGSAKPAWFVAGPVCILAAWACHILIVA
jgi:hypothetical protein